MRPYIVRQGDYLTRLAWVHGFSPDEVWNHPKNAELKAARWSQEMLCPGDILWIPEPPANRGLPLQKGTTNRYIAHVPKVTVSVRLENADGTPKANTPYWIDGAGAPIEGVTDADGRFSVDVPIHVRQLDLTVQDDYTIRRLEVGGLDPHDARSGALHRLAALGFGVQEDADDDGAGAILAFQRARALDPTGQLDPATMDALRDDHGF